jgi:hypothetical protein
MRGDTSRRLKTCTISHHFTRELPCILWNPKVHYRVHNSPPAVPILSQIKSIHTIPSYLSKIHFNIVHPPTPRSSQWSPSFRLSHQYPIRIGGKARRKGWVDNIKMDFREVGWDGMDWIDLAHDRDRWRVLVNIVMKLRVP